MAGVSLSTLKDCDTTSFKANHLMDWVSEGTGYQNVQKKTIPKNLLRN
jgi:hypothetical protein